MSTATLMKARPAGPREAEEPSMALPPAQIYPARIRLTAKLSEFERALADVEDYRGKAARALCDEQEALESTNLSESEAALAISRAQNVKSIYASRTANKEKAITALSGELSKAISDANCELRGLINIEVDRRRGIISARVLEAIEAIDRPHRAVVVAELLRYSGPIERILVLGPAPLTSMPGNNDYLVGQARDTLKKFETMIAEGGIKL
jgi:hypothetical protein